MEDTKNVEVKTETIKEENFTKADFENFMGKFKDELRTLVLDQTLQVVKNFTDTKTTIEEPKVEAVEEKKITDF